MKMIFAILLSTLTKAVHCDNGLKLRENTSQCYNRNLLKEFDQKNPRTALASLPGKNPNVTREVVRTEHLGVIISIFSTFFNFLWAKKIFFGKELICNFSVRFLKCF